MAVVVNLAGVKTKVEAIPDGAYQAVFTGKQFAMSKSNQPKVTTTWTFSAEAGEDVAGRKAFIEYSLQPQALWKLKRDLIRLGVDADSLETNIDIDELLEDLKGTEGTIHVGHHYYQGNLHNDFNVVSPDAGDVSGWATDALPEGFLAGIGSGDPSDR